MSNLLKLSTLIIFLTLFSLPLYACDNSSITINNQTTNANGSITYTLDLCVELGSLDATFYGFALAFNSSTTPPVVDLSGPFPTTTTISNATLVSGALTGTLQGLTGSNINSVANDSDWNTFQNMTNVNSGPKKNQQRKNKKSGIRETPNLLTDSDSSTNIFVSIGVKRGADSILLVPPLSPTL